MSNDANFRRRSIRLEGYDYNASGAYFITVCTYQRKCFLGEVIDETFHASEYGVLVQNIWNKLPNHYSNVELDAFVLMPNHIHGIIFLDDVEGARAGLRPAPTPAKRVPLTEIVRGLKSFSARGINELDGISERLVWQRNYYEHIIRNEGSLNKIRQYIISNPAQWTFDKENPSYQRR